MAAEQNDRVEDAPGPGPDRSDRPGSLVAGMHRRVRRLLAEVEGAMRDPSIQDELERLSGPATLEADRAMAEMKLGLEAALTGAAQLRRALTDEDPLPPLLAHLDRPLPEGLPESVERFLRERSRAPGFEFHLEDDRARGWTLVWKQRDADGHLLGAGHLYERPFSPPGR